MKLVLELSQQDSTPYRILLKDGESLKMFDGAQMKLINPEAISKLVPQGNDILVMGKDGSTCLLIDFAKAEWSLSPQLELEDGPLLTWQSFWKNLEGEEDASAAAHGKWGDEDSNWVPLDLDRSRDNDIEAALYKAEATTFRSIMDFMSIHSVSMGGLMLSQNDFLIADLHQRFKPRDLDDTPIHFARSQSQPESQESAIEEDPINPNRKIKSPEGFKRILPFLV